MDEAAIKDRIKHAMVPTDALASLGAGSPREDQAGKWAVTVLCNRPLPSDPGLVGSYKRLWQTRRGIVQTFVHGYAGPYGKQVVSEVRAAASICPTYVAEGEQLTRTVLGEYATRAPAGVDAFFAYCERAQVPYLCFAFIGHGSLVAVVASVNKDSLGNAKTDLDRVVTIAAASLRAA